MKEMLPSLKNIMRRSIRLLEVKDRKDGGKRLFKEITKTFLGVLKDMNPHIY
jgi:hypothetical protein